MRTVTHGIDCSFEHDTGSRSFNHNDRNGFLRERIGVGSAHNAQNVSSFTIPPRGRGHPFFSAIDDPIVALEFRGGSHALARRRRAGIGAPAWFTGTKPG